MLSESGIWFRRFGFWPCGAETSAVAAECSAGCFDAESSCERVNGHSLHTSFIQQERQQLLGAILSHNSSRCCGFSITSSCMITWAPG